MLYWEGNCLLYFSYKFYRSFYINCMQQCISSLLNAWFSCLLCFQGIKTEKQSEQTPPKTESRKQLPGRESRNAKPADKQSSATANRQSSNTPFPDARVRQLRDQLIRAKVYLGLGSTKTNPHFIKELRVRIREVQRALGDATKDSDLPKR